MVLSTVGKPPLGPDKMQAHRSRGMNRITIGNGFVDFSMFVVDLFHPWRGAGCGQPERHVQQSCCLIVQNAHGINEKNISSRRSLSGIMKSDFVSVVSLSSANFIARSWFSVRLSAASAADFPSTSILYSIHCKRTAMSPGCANSTSRFDGRCLIYVPLPRLRSTIPSAHSRAKASRTIGRETEKILQ